MRSERSTATAMAEFATPEALVSAVELTRALGMRALDAYTPYPIASVEEALQVPRSPIPRIVFVGGLVGAFVGYGMQFYLATIEYPLVVGALPLHSGPAFIPVGFELTILFAAVTGFLAFFVLTRLPKLYHPVFDAPGFESAQVDRFWLRLAVPDETPVAEIHDVLERAGATRVVTTGSTS